ncbi:MAG: hypothetical protein C0425_10200 [Chlorobiaceae bacterium]|nr:hypothetical protein [Chlorobiaceae bacterium]
MLKNIFIIVTALLLSYPVYGCNLSEEKNSGNSSIEMSANTRGKVGSKAADFSLQSTTGKTIKLSDYKGKIVILDFWATWCPPCRKGIPDLIAIQNEFKNDVVVIGISVDKDTKDEVPQFMKDFKINYPVVFYTDKVIKDYGGIEAIPTSFIIDQRGKTVDKHVGLVPKEAYLKVIRELLKKS